MPVLECVVNISEGTQGAHLSAFREITRPALLDLHADAFHNRAVLTLAGPTDDLHEVIAALTRLTLATLDLARHEGVHPRLGVVDVVPFVDLADPWAPATTASIAARDRYARWAAQELDLPCFLYGPERTLPEIRRNAWRTLDPDVGPRRPHPTAGAVCVGARPVLVAYNLVLSAPDIERARVIAAGLRRPGLRTLALVTGPDVQISCNLTDALRLRPDHIYDLVDAALRAAGPGAPRITRAELVGLLPEAVLEAIPAKRWDALALAPDRTIEAHQRRS